MSDNDAHDTDVMMKTIVELVERIEHDRTASIDSLRADARALLREVLAFHHAALARVLERVDAPVLAEAAKEPIVASMLELHELLPTGASPSFGSEAILPATRLVRPKASSHDASKPKETCELCGAAVGAVHPHLVALRTGSVTCACRPCALLFESQAETSPARYRRIPEHARRAPSSLANDDGWWREVGLPIGVAFFVRRDDGDVKARYPGPFGTTESTIERARWDKLAARHPSLAELAPEVEALLVHRADGAREHWILGIDRCYELVANIRQRWQGLMGGDQVRRELGRYFDALAGAAG